MPILRQCAVLNNRVTKGGGGGIWVTSGGAALIEDCVVSGNSGLNSGGGVMVLEGSTAVIRRSLIAGNSLTAGCIGYCGPGAFWSVGSAVAGSTVPNVLVESCTVVGNLGQATLGATPIGGIYGATVSDSIVRGNSGIQIDHGTATYCNVEGGAPGIGNFDADPLFVDWNGADRHLTAGSPCIDAGTPTKFDPDGSVVDVGAFPFETLYTPREAALGTTPGWVSMSAELGGAQTWKLHLGSQAAGHPYVILGSVTGTSPGVSAFGALLPLVPDWWFAFTLANPSSGVLVDTLGTLDGRGSATAALVLPPGLAAPVTAWHAALVLDPLTLQAVATNAVQLVVVP